MKLAESTYSEVRKYFHPCLFNSTSFGDAMCPVVHACNYGTPLWSIGNCIASSRFVWISIVFCQCYMILFVICFPHCLLPHNLYCLLPLTYLHASLAHFYIPQLFTHCLPTIICFMYPFICLHFHHQII